MWNNPPTRCPSVATLPGLRDLAALLCLLFSPTNGVGFIMPWSALARSSDSTKTHGSLHQFSSLEMKANEIRKTSHKRMRKGRNLGKSDYANGFTAEAYDEVKQTPTYSKPYGGKKAAINAAGLESCPCLVLNADYQPLSYLPLSLWPWQEVIKAVFSDKVTVVATYTDRAIRSARMEVALPSVIALKEFVNQHSKAPVFTRRNLYLRDQYRCQYCCKYFHAYDLTFDHVIPRALGGRGTWENVVTACGRCNNKKKALHPRDLPKIGMKLRAYPKVPTMYQLQMEARKYPIVNIHQSWEQFLYFEQHLDRAIPGDS
ncbi:unnamed protein product [Choristocarpus tenellus]